MTSDTTILITEDDSGHASLIRRYLKRAGIANPVEYFGDGEELLRFLDEKRGAMLDQYILVLDLHMPRIDGLEVLRKIRNSDELKEIPVIIITTTDNPEEIAQCRELGISGYVLKPDDFGKLSQILLKT